MRSRNNLLTSLLEKVHGPRDAALLVSGGPGSGKTWVLDQLSDRLGEQPHIYLRASSTEADWPLSGLLLLLANLKLSRPIDLEPFLPRSPAQDVDVFAVARHLQQELPEQLQPGTVVLLDDIDLMDPASLKVISFLATKMQRVRTRFVASTSQHPVPSALAAMEVMKLLELTRAESMELAKHHAGPTADPAVVALVVGQSHGVAGEILAQLQMLSERQLSGRSPLCLPLHPHSEYTTKLPQLLSTLPPSQLHQLQLVAMGPYCERSAILSLGTDPDDLDELIHRGLLESWETRVELSDTALRAEIYWSLPSEQRRVLHEQLYKATSNPALQLFHRSFVNCTEVPALILLTQGIKLVAQGQVNAAVEVAERALNLDTSTNQLSTTLTDLASALFDAANLQTAGRYLKWARRQGPDSCTELRLATLEVKIAATAGHTIPELGTTALVRAHREKYPILCGQLLASMACAHALREETDAARSALDAASTLLREATQQELVPHTQATILLAALEMDHAALLRRHQQLLASSDEQAGVEVRHSLAIALLNMGYHQETREILSRMNTQGSESSPLLQQLTLLLSAANAIQNENVPRAMTLVERWIALDAPALLEPTPQLIQAWYWMNKNRQDMAGSFFENMQPRVLGELSPKLLAKISMLAADNDLMNSQYERAVETYRRTLGLYQGAADIRYVRATTHLIEALVLTGRTSEAISEYRERQHQMSQVPGRRAKLTMRLAQALVLDGENSISRFHALLAQWTPSDSSFELARIRHALGHRLQAMDEAEAAREHLVAARSLYRSLGAKAWVINVENCLAIRTPLSNAAAPVDFSREELEVVRMVHEGLTNKAIAKQLYISVSAVEARLTKLYRRTGAKNRQQLAARFTQAQPSAAG